MIRLALLGAALIAYAALIADGYGLRLLVNAGALALTALGYQLIFGLGGALSLAQAALAGLGAYAAALGGVGLGLPFGGSLALAGLAGMLGALLLTAPVRHLDTHYFALATLGGAQITHLLANHWESVTGGANGLAGVPPLPGGAGGLPAVLLVWSLAGVAALGLRQLVGSRLGARIALARLDPRCAAVSGINRSGLLFGLSLGAGGLAGLGGGVQAGALGLVSPEFTAFSGMIGVLAAAVIGGRGGALGTCLAALLLTHLPEVLRGFADWYLAATALAMLVVTLFLPAGLGWLDGRARVILAPARSPRLGRAEILRLEGLRCRFGGIEAVAGVDLTLPAGARLAVIGANGSGKTSLLNLISGLAPIADGRILYGDHALTRLPPARRARLGLARMFQTPPHLPDLPPLSLIAAAGGDAETLAMVGLPADCAWAALGPAGRRRLDLARALAGGPGLLLLDEPGAGLAEAEKAAFAALLVTQLDRCGAGCMIVDHDPDFLARIATRYVCLDQGRIVSAGVMADLAADPIVRRAYFGTGGA